MVLLLQGSFSLRISLAFTDFLSLIEKKMALECNKTCNAPQSESRRSLAYISSTDGPVSGTVGGSESACWRTARSTLQLHCKCCWFLLSPWGSVIFSDGAFLLTVGFSFSSTHYGAELFIPK